MKWLVLLLICIGHNTLNAQFKYEKESRVTKKDVPQPAIDFTAKLNFDKKMKWFKEHSESGTSYEVKSCRNREKYSVEFDENGLLQDIEKDVKLKDLAAHDQQFIVSELNDKFEKYKLKKIQIQVKGKNSDLVQYVLSGKIGNQVIRSFEVVVKGNTTQDSHTKHYEVLIHSDKGVLSMKEIISRPTDNLLF